MAEATVIGQTIFLRGTIRGEGDLEIHGRIEGEVDVAGDVTIAEGALVKADVTARRIVVRGAVAGNLSGEDLVRLEDGARVVGDVKGKSVGILDGALFRGNLETAGAGEPARPAARPARAEQRTPVRTEARGRAGARAEAVPPRPVAPPPAPVPVPEERPAAPLPVVPVLKRVRGAMKKRAR